MEIKIADFGFSCIYDPKEGLDIGLGTPLYIAPELIQKKVYNEKVDIWATIVITYMLLSEQTPFACKTKAELNSNIINASPKYGQEFKNVS